MGADATRLRNGLQSWALQVQRQAVPTTAALMRSTGDVPIDGGELRSSIRDDGVVTSTGTRFAGRIVAPVIQAATTDKGARPHPIRPRRRGGLLVFPGSGRGGMVFTQRVNHPGNPPDPWWRRALERDWPQALRLAARSVPFR